MKIRDFHSVDEVRSLETDVRAAASAAADKLGELLMDGDPLELLAQMKFNRIGRDPLQPTRELNLIEQVNQTFTYLVSVRAVEFLFRAHPEIASYRLNLGTASGSDIVADDGSVAAEVFAATKPSSNNKLRKDIAKVKTSEAQHQYVFFHCPGDYVRETVEGVRVVPLSLEAGGIT